jgi:hypothetical protein
MQAITLPLRGMPYANKGHTLEGHQSKCNHKEESSHEVIRPHFKMNMKNNE